ncbi:MAG: hypothetical protein ABI147_09770 [Acidobacteriaceae bacterium]
MHRLLRSALFLAFAFAVHASAEARVCIGGDLDHLSLPQKMDCLRSAIMVRGGIARFHAPEDWRYFVICTESDWKTYVAFSKRSARELETMGADTDLVGRTTFFRGEWLRNANTHSPVAEKIIAREVASAVLQSVDEVAISKQVERWIPKPDQNALVLKASR